MADKPKTTWPVDYVAISAFVLIETAIAAAFVFGR
jgi:hypothetical protein